MNKPTKFEKAIARMIYDLMLEVIHPPSFSEQFDKAYAASRKKQPAAKKEKKPKFTQQFTAGETVDSTQFDKRAVSSKKQEESKPSIPSNIKEFTLPDGSVIYINTDKTEMEVNDASDYFK